MSDRVKTSSKPWGMAMAMDAMGHDGSWHRTLLQTPKQHGRTKGPLFPSEESSDKEERFPRTWVQFNGYYKAMANIESLEN